MTEVFDPCGKIWKVLPQVLAQHYNWWGQYPYIPPSVPIEHYCHHVLVLGWAGIPGSVKIAMVGLLVEEKATLADYQKIVASIPPSPYANPTDFYLICGTSHGKTRSYDKKVKLRRNPQLEGLVLDCYIRMDSIRIVPLSILFWRAEMQYGPPGHQLMLQRESMAKLDAHLEMKERESSRAMASMGPHSAALSLMAEEPKDTEQAVQLSVTLPELATYGLTELNEDSEPVGHAQYLGYITGPSDTACAYAPLATASSEP